MKTIQWYPGHMAKAMRMIEESVSLADGIIYVLDARCPAASFNKKLLSAIGNKPVLYVLNKIDLADEKVDLLAKAMGVRFVKLNGVKSSSRRDILGAIDKMVAEKREKTLAKGYNKTFRFLVIGVPNTGKSTVINLLAGAKEAQTGDKAGVTRGKQWIRFDGYDLLDTPGTMPPSLENQALALHLAYAGSINDDILDLDDIALELLGELCAKYPNRLKDRYGITGGSNLEMLECVCKRMGFILRGGEYDFERGEKCVIDDFRKGRLGRITLDSIEDIKSCFGEING